MINPLRFYIFGSILSLLLSQQLFAQAHIPGGNVNGVHVERNSPSALPEKIQFKNFTLEQGLSSNYVQSIIQDSKGFLWAGTMNGLSRYDGRKFKIFKHSADDPNSLGSNTVLSLCVDKSGILWVGTEGGGLNRYNPAQENFTRYINPNDPSSVANSYMSILEDSHGVLWLAGLHSGLYIFDRESEQFTGYKNIPGDSTSLSDNQVWTIFEDSKGNLWIGTLFGGLNKFDRNEQKFTRYLYSSTDPNRESKKTILSICEDYSGALWIATFGGGLYKFNYINDTLLPDITNFNYDPDKPGSLNDSCIASLCMDKNNILWLGTLQGGLNRTVPGLNDDSALSFIAYEPDPADPFSLKNNNVACLYLDRSGLLWIGTWGGGLSLHDPEKKPFRHFAHHPDQPFSLSSNSVTTVYEDKSGILWIGTQDSGLNKWDKITNSFKQYKHNPNDPGSLSNNRITEIYQDRSGILWVGTYSEGLNQFDSKTGKFNVYRYDPLNPNSLSNNMITSIVEDTAGVLWIGTNFDGLNRFDKENGQFEHFRYIADNTNSLSSNVMSTLYADNSGILWIGASAGGLDVFDYQNKKFINYHHDPVDPNSLSDNVVSVIYEDKTGTFWIGTGDGGLNKFNKESGHFRHFTMQDGLPSDAINKILEDDRGNLWISTSNGLSKFNPQTETFRNYDSEDGLPSRGLGAGCKSKTGELIFGSSNGFIIFHPDSLKDNTHLPPVYITDFYLFNKPVPVGYDSLSHREILKKSLVEGNELELNYADKVFSIEFAALDFHAPLKNKYAYLMEGFDRDWTYTDAGRALATYTNLDPGKYIFRVKASNNDGLWNEVGTSLKIIILPPWWRTTWAYLIYFSLMAGLVYFIWKAQLKRIRIKHEYEMSRFEARKLQEVDEMKSRFFTNISHEFRTPLTLILGPVRQMIEKLNEGKMKDDLSMVHRNAYKLLGLVNQLLDIAKLESGNMKLQAVPQNIVPLVKALVLSFMSYAERKRITLKFNSTSDEIIAYLDKEKIEKIITNILSNAFKFTPEGGGISVDVRVSRPFVPTSTPLSTPPLSKGGNNGGVEVCITDTGVGIPADKLPHIFDRFYQVDGSQTREQEGTGIGLALTKELVELHKGKITVESEEGKGTNFTVNLPLGKDHLKSEEISEVVEEEKFAGSELYQKWEDLEDKTLLESAGEIKVRTSQQIDSALFENETLPLLLIVEDNSDVRKYLRDNLINEFSVQEAIHGEDGWNKAVLHIPDLIISDVMMPKMDGFKLCEKLKTDERTSHIPVILLTAKAAKEDKIEGYETGADEYIMKPFEPDELKVRIKNLIEQRKRLHQHFQKQGIFEIAQTKITSVDKRFLQKVYEIISENISNELFSVEMLTGRLGVSKSILHKKIVSLTGEPPVKLIRRIRLNRALKLIEGQFGNLSEIALEVGFNNPAYFSGCFKKQFGVSPSEYQHNHKIS